MFLRGRGLQLFRSIAPGVRTETEVALRNNHKFVGVNRCLPVEADPSISPCRRLGLQKRYFGYENYPKWPPYTLDKHGQVKQKKLTKQAGHMLKLIEQELAETSPVSREKVINADFEVGDSVEVKFYNNFSTKKMQSFVGIVIAKRNRGINSSFTVRNIIFGMGVERQFPLYMPLLQEVKVLTKRVIHKGKREGKKIRRAKLYYLRDRPASQSTITVKLTKIEKAEKLKVRMKMKRDRKKAKRRKK